MAANRSEDASHHPERRSSPRRKVEGSALIHVVRSGSTIHGRILDLSLGGCHIRTSDPLLTGIYTRVEVEFSLEGSPFRLSGVMQNFHDRQHRDVGIRFLDLSERKREQVQDLIHEIEEGWAQGKK